MRDLPAGIVTYLFTDIEGSTRLAQELGTAWLGVLDQHERLLRQAIVANDGVVVSTAGDGMFAAFAAPAAALSGAVLAERAVARASWPEGARLRVRMGLHTGVAQFAGTDYAGLEVHRAARIAGAAHGGQLIISAATERRVAAMLPADVTLRDLGVHRLKDLVDPEHLFQVCAAGLPVDFPQLRSVGTRLRTLPPRVPGFVGRADEVERITALLASPDVVTVTGPGGIGKTSLAIEVATRLEPGLRDGVLFVSLAALREATQLAPAIARILDIPEEPGRPPEEVVIARLAAAQMLLVLDNLEQLPEAGRVVAQVAGAGPELRVLATSRAPLHIRGELEFRLDPLALPDPQLAADPETLGEVAAVRLFVERARLVDPNFRLNATNAAAVADICRRLEGLPLAIELAAARLRVLTPESILRRLDDRLQLLTGGARDAPERQQTLRAAIDWSHDLLDAPAQVLLRRLGVFRGGWSLDAAEAVAEAPEAIETLDALIGHSLVVRDDPDGAVEPRFRMLETIREYALERLRLAGELDRVRDAHLAWFCALADGGDATLEREHDNLRAALAWAVQTDPESGLGIANRLARFWLTHDHVREGEEWIVRLLDATGASRPETRARALAELAGLRYWQGHYPQAEADYRASLASFRELGDVIAENDVLYSLGWVLAARADWPGAQAIFTQALGACRQRADPRRTGLALQALGMAQHGGGDQSAARTSLEEAVRVLDVAGEPYGLANAHYDLARTLHAQGDAAAAWPHLRQALLLHAGAGRLPDVAFVLDAISRLDADSGDLERAVMLAAGADRVRATLAAHPPEAIVERWDVAAAVGDRLPADVRDAAWARGSRLTLSELIDLGKEAGNGQ